MTLYIISKGIVMIQEWIPFSFSALSLEALLEPKVSIWLLGTVLLVLGARFYQLLIMAPGFGIGALIALRYMPSNSQLVQFAAILVIGAVCAVALMTVEKLSVSLSGAFVGVAILSQGAPLFGAASPPPYAFAIGALLGSMIFPKFYDDFRPVVTATVGAFCIAWSVNKEGALSSIAIIACVGALLQYFLTAREPKKSRISA
jgi:hypothetical protein